MTRCVPEQLTLTDAGRTDDHDRSADARRQRRHQPAQPIPLEVVTDELAPIAVQLFRCPTLHAKPLYIRGHAPAATVSASAPLDTHHDGVRRRG